MKELASLDALSLSDGELRDAQVDLARLGAAFTAAQARVAVVWDADGAKSGAAWLARETREPKAVCTSRLRLGRVVRDMPLVDAAWSAGDITIDHVRRLAGLRNRRTRSAFARDEAILVEAARTTTFAEFNQITEYWMQHADPDGAEQSDVDRRDRRRVSLDQTFAGSYSGSMFLDPISSAIVSGELERLEQELFDADWAEAKQRLGSALRRRPAQGLATFDPLSHSCGPPDRQNCAKAADGDASDVSCRGEQIVAGGGAARGEHDHGEALALREVAVLCYHKYCDIPSHKCQIDHIEPWIAGGITSQDNGRVACGYHNRLRHRRPPPPG